MIYTDQQWKVNQSPQVGGNGISIKHQKNYAQPYGDKNVMYSNDDVTMMNYIIQPQVEYNNTAPFLPTNDVTMMKNNWSRITDKNNMNMTNNQGQYTYTNDQSPNNDQSPQFSQLSNTYKHANGTYYPIDWFPPRYRNGYTSTASSSSTVTSSTYGVRYGPAKLTTFGSIISGEGYDYDSTQSFSTTNNTSQSDWSVIENDSMDHIDPSQNNAYNQQPADQSPEEGWLIYSSYVNVEPAAHISKFPFQLNVANEIMISDRKKTVKDFKIKMAKLLISAIKRNDKNMCNTILQYNGDDIPINEMNSDGMTILMAACQFGKFYLVRYCLDRGADLFLSERSGKTALMHCCMTQTKSAAFKAYHLLQAGADVDECDTNGTTPLMLAAINGHTSVVKLLLSNSADPNLKNKWRYTALMYAVEKNKVEEVKIFLAHPATRVNTKNQFGQNILMRAAQLGHKEIIRLLIDPFHSSLYYKQVSINDVDGKGQTCFHYARHDEILDLMMHCAKMSSKQELKRFVKNMEKDKTVQIFKRMSQNLESMTNK